MIHIKFRRRDDKREKRKKNLFHNRNLIIDCCWREWRVCSGPFFLSLFWLIRTQRAHTRTFRAAACHWFLIVIDSFWDTSILYYIFFFFAARRAAELLCFGRCRRWSLILIWWFICGYTNWDSFVYKIFFYYTIRRSLSTLYRNEFGTISTENFLYFFLSPWFLLGSSSGREEIDV